MKGIQLLRALCAFQVLFSHSFNVYQSSFGIEFGKTPLHFLFDGQCGVIVFLLLSGFFYYNERELTLRLYVRKILSKSLHIFPPYWVSIILGTVLCNFYIEHGIIGYNDEFTNWIASFWRKEISVSDFLKALLLFPLESTQLINPPSWYLLIEVKMYFIMPLLIHIFNKYSWKLAYLLIIVSAPLSSDLNIVAVCGIFTLGACIHKYIHNRNKHTLSLKFMLLSVCIGIVLLNIQNEIYIPYYLLFQSIGAGLLVYVFYNTRLKFIDTFFSKLIFVGDISYEIYILHFVFLLVLMPFFINDTIYLTIATFVITIIVAYPLNKLNKVLSQKSLQVFDKIINTH